jgi:ABC-2 type transport system permease protein
MTVITAPPASPVAGRHRDVLVNALRAELYKLCTVRSTYVAVLAAFAANVGFAVLAAALIAPRLSAHDRASIDVVELALAGLHLSQIAFGVLGALVITSEYSSGMIRVTLAATPRRRVLLAAKALVLAGVTLVTATASTFAAYLAFQAALPAGTLARTTLSDPGIARAVAGGGLFLTVLALLGFGLGVLLRSSAAAIATLLGLLFVPPLLLELLPGSWNSAIGRYVPMEAGSQVYIAAHRAPAALGPWAGLGVFALYAVVAVLAGAFLAGRRDA